MLIGEKEDKYETEVKHSVCSYHKKHPGVPWAGCTCASSICQKRVETEQAHPPDGDSGANQTTGYMKAVKGSYARRR